ncbi:glycosyltransferase family 2 protein [Flaviaesturariibacter amylovorans]|uniref:Glycosyltransferase family 2 protein n=1 Tax=Flaviaesturariibacter amylovorans TaxID=1084520 RepID=A0ABP8G839_9BACT
MLFYYGILAALFWTGLAVALTYYRRRIPFLADVAPEPGTEAVALIIAIRNEEADLPGALDTLVRLRYPNLRILLVNDRSTDGTGAILADYAQRYPQLQVRTIAELPAGWLGKNHALYEGYRASSEEWILFADADIQFAPDTLLQALTWSRRHRLDHLTLLPYVRSRSEALNALLSTFATMLEMRQRPWAVRDPKSSATIGVGAFNLVRRSAYERAGTHKALALRPDDDLQLGARIKASGGRCDALYGRGAIALEWYDSVGAFVDGLMKNMFSVYNYRLPLLLVAGVLPTLLFLVLPLPLLVLFGGPREWILAALVLLGQLGAVGTGRGKYSRLGHGLLVPAAGAVLVWVMLRAAVTNLAQGGIWWRGHFYPLSELRADKGEKNW